MGFSIASVVLSYFMIAGGTFGAGLLAGKLGIHSEYLGYIILAAGGFVGGVVAARASKGTTVLEPAIGGALLFVSLFGVGIAASGGDASIMLVPANMKGIALTAGASAAGGIGGAFIAERLFGNVRAGSGGWIIYIAVAAFGAGVLSSIFGAALAAKSGGGSGSGSLFAMLLATTLIVGIAAGASATTRILGASFLGTIIGMGGFLFLAVYLFITMFGSLERGGETAGVPSEVYMGLAVISLGAGIVSLIGTLAGWSIWGKKQA